MHVLNIQLDIPLLNHHFKFDYIIKHNKEISLGLHAGFWADMLTVCVVCIEKIHTSSYGDTITYMHIKTFSIIMHHSVRFKSQFRESENGQNLKN